MMPKKDGIQTLKEMKAEKNNPNLDTPIICLTANAVSGAKEKYISAGFDEYLTKPIDPSKLEDMLITYLPQKKLKAGLEKTVADNAESSDNPDNADGTIPQFVHSINEIDIEAGIRNCGTEEIYLETLKTYANMIDGHIKETEDFYKAGDISNTTIKIHALKSTSRIIGAVEIGETAQELENAGNNGDTQKLDREIDRLLDRCRKLSEQLAPLREGKDTAHDETADSGTLPMISDEEFADALSVIKEFAAVCDRNSISGVLEDLKEYNLDSEKKEKIEAVKKAVNELDFEKIVQI